MPLHNHHNNQDLFQQIVAAASPGTDPSIRRDLVQHLRTLQPDDDTLKGLLLFLEDHDYDFEKLHSFLSEEQKTIGKRKPTYASFRRIAAVFVLLFFSSVIAWVLFQQKAARIERYMVYEPGLPVFASFPQTKTFQEMISAYRLQEWNQGLELYHQLSKGSPQNDTLQYFGGWFHHETGNYDSAVSCFYQVTLKSHSYYKEKAEMMLAINAYLNKDFNAAKSMLYTISKQPGHPYWKMAREMINDQKLW